MASACSLAARTRLSTLTTSVQPLNLLSSAFKPRFLPTSTSFTALPARSLTVDRVMTVPRPRDKDESREEAASINYENDFFKEEGIRIPRNVQAAYLRPMKRDSTQGVPVCDLQLRSYSARNVEFMADFALRAAYYLKMPASGPIPLPKMIKRWTVPRSNFIHKKSQENFERVTLRRLIQIKDAHPETVQIWLAFLRKHVFHGVGMKANVWHHEKLAVAESMDAYEKDMRPSLDQQWGLFGRKNDVDVEEKVLDTMHTDVQRTAIEVSELYYTSSNSWPPSRVSSQQRLGRWYGISYKP